MEKYFCLTILLNTRPSRSPTPTLSTKLFESIKAGGERERERHGGGGEGGERRVGWVDQFKAVCERERVCERESCALALDVCARTCVSGVWEEEFT